MNSSFWQSTNYGTSNENSHEVADDVSSFSNNLRNLELNYDTSSVLGIQTGGGAERDQSPPNSSSTTDAHYRIASTPHMPSDAFFHHSTANFDPTYNNSTPLPGFALGSPLPNLSPLSLLHNPTLYAPNNDASYNVTSSSHPTTAYSFAPPSSFEQRSRLDFSPPLYSGMPPPTLRNALFPTSPSLIPMSLRHDFISYHNRPLQSNVNPFQVPSSPSPPLSSISRGAGSVVDRTSPSSSSYGYGPNTLHLDIPAGVVLGKEAPPFEATKGFLQMIDDAGRQVTSEIHAKIDKGFFRADTDWCCYRRNYFAVACSYNLVGSRGEVDCNNVYLVRAEQRDICRGFYVCIAAKVDGEDGRAIELVKHTAKRDKGPMTQPEKRPLRPNPSGNLCLFSGPSTFDSPHQSIGGDYHDPYQLGNLQDAPSVANFDRIQFKKATANNGKRRAAQQYFHIVVELYTKIRKPSGVEDYVKVAHRLSDPMVVRGRSPGHYADGTRTSGNMGGGTGAGGGYGTSSSRDSGSSCGMNPDPTMSTGHYPIRSGGPSTYHSHSHIVTAPYTNLSPISTGLFYHQPMEGLSGSESSTQSQSSVDYRSKCSPDHDSQPRPYTIPGHASKPTAMFDRLAPAGLQVSYDSPDNYALPTDEPFFKRYVKMEEKHFPAGIPPLQQPSLLST